MHHASTQWKIRLKALFITKNATVYTNTGQEHSGHWSLKTKKVHAIHLTRKELTTLLASRRKFYASLTNVSHEHSGHSSLKTKRVHAHPPHKKRTDYPNYWPPVGSFTPASQMRAKNNLATDHGKQKSSIPTHKRMDKPPLMRLPWFRQNLCDELWYNPNLCDWL